MAHLLALFKIRNILSKAAALHRLALVCILNPINTVRFCSTCEHLGHNLFYVDNTAQVQGGLQGMLDEEYSADLVEVLIHNYSKTCVR